MLLLESCVTLYSVNRSRQDLKIKYVKVRTPALYCSHAGTCTVVAHVWKPPKRRKIASSDRAFQDHSTIHYCNATFDQAANANNNLNIK